MLEWLVSIDTKLFVFLNTQLANPVFDFIMPIATDRWFLRGVFGVILLWLLIFGKRRGWIAAIFCIATVALADQLSAQALKPIVSRIRPCHVIQSAHLLVDCSQGLSFPSSHAANTFSLATYLAATYPQTTWYVLAFAAIVSYSRVAVGVHYPLDVLVGAMVGVLSGVVVVMLQRWASRNLQFFRTK
ncbi:MAG: phosphatase PAP2 family protein [Candidatus Zixiibacteriota bacterium]